MYELHARLGKWKPATTKRAQTTQLASFWALGMSFLFFFLRFFNILTNDLEIPTLKQSHPVSMPRADSKQHLGTQFYHSRFSNSPYLPEPSSSPQLSPTSHSTTPSSTPATMSAPKKKHVCSTCERAFTTSGHLAHHSAHTHCCEPL